ncbi:MAG: YqaE/Pmp3 family membrane protein [Bacteroidetes bacterium]|nr:YqaE/Pmp3 family membrane protein [Bacteroidota bacterium]
MVVVKGEDYFQLLDDDVSLEMENFILFILCIVAPPVAVYIKFGGKGKKIRTVIFLTILGWIPGVFYAFFQISGDD